MKMINAFMWISASSFLLTVVCQEQTTTSLASKRTTLSATAMKEGSPLTPTTVLTSSTGEKVTTPLTTAGSLDLVTDASISSSAVQSGANEQTTTGAPSKRPTPFITAMKEVTPSTTTGVITSSTRENMTTPLTTVDIDVECYTRSDGADYRGTVSTTDDGKTCQKWTSQTPHEHEYTPANFPDSGLGDHNYCRNPDGYSRAWCYTKRRNTRWEICDIGKPQTTCIGRDQTTTSLTTLKVTSPKAATDDVTMSSVATSNSKVAGSVMTFIVGALLVINHLT